MAKGGSHSLSLKILTGIGESASGSFQEGKEESMT